MGTWKEGFHRRSKGGDFGKSKLLSLGGFLLVYHAQICKGFFLPWLTFRLWAKKIGFSVKALFGEEKLDFWVMFDVSSPKRRCESSQGRLVLHLGEGMVRLG